MAAPTGAGLTAEWAVAGADDGASSRVAVRNCPLAAGRGIPAARCIAVALIGLVERPLLAGIVGEETEQGAYRYVACDRGRT